MCYGSGCEILCYDGGGLPSNLRVSTAVATNVWLIMPMQALHWKRKKGRWSELKACATSNPAIGEEVQWIYRALTRCSLAAFRCH